MPTAEITKNSANINVLLCASESIALVVASLNVFSAIFRTVMSVSTPTNRKNKSMSSLDLVISYICDLIIFIIFTLYNQFLSRFLNTTYPMIIYRAAVISEKPMVLTIMSLVIL